MLLICLGFRSKQATTGKSNDEAGNPRGLAAKWLATFSPRQLMIYQSLRFFVFEGRVAIARLVSSLTGMKFQLERRSRGLSLGV